MRAKKNVNQSSDFPVRRTGSYRHKNTGEGGSGGPGTPQSNPTKILRIKRVHTTHALHIRLIELWMSWMNWELRSINCYELVGYFWATARTLVQKSRVAITSFIGPPNQKSWLRQWSSLALIESSRVWCLVSLSRLTAPATTVSQFAVRL